MIFRSIRALHSKSLNRKEGLPRDGNSLVVLSEGVQHGLGHLHPPHVENKLEGRHDREVEVDLGLVVGVFGDDVLAGEDAHEEVGVDGETDQLRVHDGDGHLSHRIPWICLLLTQS